MCVRVCACVFSFSGLGTAIDNTWTLLNQGFRVIAVRCYLSQGFIKSGARSVPEMTGQLDALDDEDLADIATYYAGKTMQLSGSNKQTVQLNSGLKVDGLALGAKVYRAGNAESGVPACSGCHSPRGLGNAPAGYPRLGGQHADYIVKQLKDFRAGNRTSDGEAMPMRGVAQHMSDAEIDAVANFISGLN